MASDPRPNATCKPSYRLQDMDELKHVFHRFDANGDGKISETELADVMKALGLQTSADEIQRVMTEIDSDKDGFVNLDEFAAFCKGGDDEDEDVRDAFNHYDQDRDGFISSSELHLVLTRLGQACTVEDCATMISSVDTNHDGHVSFEEFKKMMANKKQT